MAQVRVMSALPPKADIAQHRGNVRFVPIADIYRAQFGPDNKKIESGSSLGNGLTPGRADAVGSARDFNLAGDLQTLAVEADDGERVVHHALREQGLAVVAPRDALRPLPDFDFGHPSQCSSIHAEHDQQPVIVVERMARCQI